MSPPPLAQGRAFRLTGQKERADQIGATLILHSKPGYGTTVRVDVPLRATRGKRGGIECHHRSNCLSWMIILSSERGLVALLRTVTGMGVVAEASDAEEAVKLHRQHLPDVTLMDLFLCGGRASQGKPAAKVWRTATDAELKALLLARAPVEKERIETELRNGSGITNGHGKFVAGVVLITGGYSAEGKYSHFFVTEVPLQIGDNTLPPGNYVLGWERGEAMLNVHFTMLQLARSAPLSRQETYRDRRASSHSEFSRRRGVCHSDRPLRHTVPACAYVRLQGQHKFTDSVLDH